MMTSIEMLKNLFDSNCLAINFLRNFGLSLTNHITPIKVIILLSLLLFIIIKRMKLFILLEGNI